MADNPKKTITVAEVKEATGRITIKTTEGETYSFFRDYNGVENRQYVQFKDFGVQSGSTVEIEYKMNGDYKNITAFGIPAAVAPPQGVQTPPPAMAPQAVEGLYAPTIPQTGDNVPTKEQKAIWKSVALQMAVQACAEYNKFDRDNKIISTARMFYSEYFLNQPKAGGQVQQSTSPVSQMTPPPEEVNTNVVPF